MSREDGGSKRRAREKRKHLIGKRASRGKVAQTQRLRRLTPRQQDERVRCLAAINRRRRGEASSLSAAARAERTTLRAIRTLLPAALTQDRPGARIRVKASDRYSARVQITAIHGPLDVTAHGSRERELAGRQRAVLLKVARNELPPSALEQFRGKTVGGYELLADFEQLSVQAQAGILPQLDTLYVSPDTSA
jgi:hypothetical protein